MNPQASRLDLERFRTAITQKVGLQFDDAKLGFLGEVLQRRLDKTGGSREAYVAGLQHESANDEIAALARELTVGETYFFRNIEQFRALAEVVLPERMRPDRMPPKTLRLLSAGCASGEEAYSLAMVARETIIDPSWEIIIRAVDLNPGVLEKAARGRYSTWALRETPPDVRLRWFRAEGCELHLDASVRTAVTFEAANLASDDPQLWQPASYDVIFCRNVLMYFAPEKMRAVIARIARSLVPGGFLFLGHVETLRGVSDEFHLRHTHGTFYYERKEHIGRPFPQPLPPMPQAINADGPAYAASDAWFRTISESTERIAALVPTPARAGLAAGPPARTWDLAPAFELLRKERFAEALDYIRAGPPAGRDPDMLLLEAALLVHGQKVEAAEETCSRLLCIDELNAGAHYVLGLCREQLRDVDGAIEHYRVAAYLDPEFAMPRLHLGLLARRAGERGGFNREALMALCGSALADNGVRA